MAARKHSSTWEKVLYRCKLFRRKYLGDKNQDASLTKEKQYALDERQIELYFLGLLTAMI